MAKYRYASVRPKGIGRAYSYICDEESIKVGSYVLIPFGRENDVRLGEVLSVDDFDEENVPFPLNRTKRILAEVSKEEYEAGLSGDESNDKKLTHEQEKELNELNRYLDSNSEYDYEKLFDWAYEHDEPSANPRIVAAVIRCYELCVEQNNPVAALNLGSIYYNGVVVPQDYIKAATLYKIAADCGEAVAIRNLGYCYYYGRHQAVDYEQAYACFSKGALLFGDANCYYKLGDMFLNGYATPQNELYAWICYNHAYEISTHDEQFEYCKADIFFRLGKCKLHGIGTDVDLEKAHFLLSAACTGFYDRRKTDPFVKNLIHKAKLMLAEIEERFDGEFVDFME